MKRKTWLLAAAEHGPPRVACILALALALPVSALAEVDPYDPWVRARALEEKKAAALVEKGGGYEDAGRPASALKSYRRAVAKYRMAPSAAEAQFRIAKLLEAGRDHRAAFDAYQAMIDHFKGTGHFVDAVERQFAIAKGALDLRRRATRYGQRIGKKRLTGGYGGGQDV